MSREEARLSVLKQLVDGVRWQPRLIFIRELINANEIGIEEIF